MKISDIAKMANVSKATVSLALNGKPGVSPETREKILKIVYEHGYVKRPLTLANRAHASSRVLRLVALTNSGIISDEYHKQPFFAELIRHIEDHCSSRGYSLLFSSLQSDNLISEIEKVENGHPANGIILIGTNLSKEQISSIAKQIDHLVVLDTFFESLPVDFVVMNNFMGGYQAAKYLIEKGHRKIGYVRSKNRMYNFDSRMRGFYAALEEYSITIDKNDIFTIAPTVVTSQDIFVEQFKRRKDDHPTALFCECDYMAISVIKSMMELGLRVPDDVSVIGFDNISEAEIITPELTTIHVDKAKIAAIAVERLIERLENPGHNIHIKTIVDTTLVERKSTRAL